MSILDWILVTIGGILFIIPIFLLMCMGLYCLFKMMGGIYEIFYNKEVEE